MKAYAVNLFDTKHIVFAPNAGRAKAVVAKAAWRAGYQWFAIFRAIRAHRERDLDAKASVLEPFEMYTTEQVRSRYMPEWAVPQEGFPR